MTNDELVKALRICADTCCIICPRRVSDNCTIDKLTGAAADAIEKMAEWQNPAWISVEERLPEFHEEVLVYAIGKEDAFTPVMAVSEIYIFKLLPFSNGTIEWRDPWDYFNKNYKVTHWMPLPKPPQGE